MAVWGVEWDGDEIVSNDERGQRMMWMDWIVGWMAGLGLDAAPFTNNRPSQADAPSLGPCQPQIDHSCVWGLLLPGRSIDSTPHPKVRTHPISPPSIACLALGYTTDGVRPAEAFARQGPPASTPPIPLGAAALLGAL